MRIQSCEQPKRIYNSYLKEYMYVPCGHCNTCNNRKSLLWVQRLKRESDCHRYKVFLTLTYSEEFCPMVDFSSLTENGFYVTKNYDYDFVPYPSGAFDERSCKLISAGSGFVRVLDYRDVQLFFKRLRKKIYTEYGKARKQNSTSENIEPSLRYWCTGEYGPTTFRPHYHLILWFDSEWLNSRLEEFLLDSWKIKGRPIGFLDWSYIAKDAAQYVAQYTNCNCHLPNVLTFSPFAPFGRGSRRPPLGTLLQSNEEIQKIFHNGIVSISVPRKDGEVPFSIPLFPSFKNRLFPKCLRFSKISTTNRTACYTINERFFSREEFESEDQYLSDMTNILRHFDDFESSDTFVYQYIREITDCFTDVRPLLRQLDICERVKAQASVFGCSVAYYVSRIENYYENCERETLKSWFTFCEEYSKTHDSKDLLFSDLDFIQDVYDSLSKIPSLMFDCYDLEKFSADLNNFNLDRLDDFKNMRLLNRKIQIDSTKTKKKNDYLAAHPELAVFNSI